jgi:glycosyltransferase involved in cell wall biosynthesis
MKIAFLVEYFTPVYFGGSEVSAELFAKHLVNEHQLDIVVVAPKLTDASYNEKRDGYQIIRYLFPATIVRHKPLSQFWHNSIFLSIWRAFFIIKICLKEKPDIIHVQEKYLLISGLLTKLFLRKKIILTIRDYQLLCPTGFCIKEKHGYRACNIFEFFAKDVQYYFKNYAPGVRLLQIIFLLRARIISKIYRFCLCFVDEIVFISQKQKKIYGINGVKKGQVIYNIAEFVKPDSQEKTIDVLFIGKPSIGKGIKILNEIKKRLIRENINIKIIGGESFVQPQKLREYYEHAKLTITPSVWEEPFGRVALESLTALTPVLATDRGGLPEIVEDNVMGLIAPADAESLLKKLRYLNNHYQEFQKRIDANYNSLKEKFFYRPLNQYFKLYKKLS